MTPYPKISIPSLIIFLLASLFCNAQKSNTFQQSFGGSANDFGCSTVLLPDKGYIIAGVTASFGSGGYDIMLIRTDSVGKKIWSKTYGGSGDEGIPYYLWFANVDIIMAPDSNVVICTNTKSYGAGGVDVYLFKVDLNGNLKWAKTYGGMGDDYGYSVINDPKGGFMISGETFSYGAGSGDVLVIKTDTVGKIVWAKAYGSGGNEEAAWKVRASRDGNYFLCGYSHSISTAYDQMFMKIDANGKLLFNKIYGTTSYDNATEILDLPDSTIYLAGFTYNPFNGANTVAILSKFDKSGNLSWTYMYDKSRHTDFHAVLYDSVNKVFNCLLGESDIHRIGLIRTDLSGKFIFLKNYGPVSGSGAYTYGLGHDLLQLPSGGFALPYVTNDFGFGGWDYFFVKVDKNGTNSDSCNITPVTLTPFDFTSYISNYTYTFTTTSISPSVGSGMNITSPNVKDTLVCSPFITEFNWQAPCLGQATMFEDSSYSKPTSWKWNFGDGSSPSTSQCPTHAYSKTGTYTVKLISSNGSATDSITKKDNDLSITHPA